MTQRHVLLIGGTGTVGSALVNEVVAAGAVARVATRDPTRHAKLTPGAIAVRFDLQDPATFDPALDGAEGVFVLSPPGHVRQDQLLAPFVERAALRARKIVTMTANGVQFDEQNPLRRLELQVSSSKVPFVHLRPGWFMQNFQSFWLPSIEREGVIALPAGDARTAFVDARDIAGVAAKALLTSSFDGQALTLTGPAALTYAEAAEELARASGRAIRYAPIDDARFVAGMVAAGLPADYAAVLVALFGTVRHGFAATVDDSVARILGRARSLADYARDHAAVWR